MWLSVNIAYHNNPVYSSRSSDGICQHNVLSLAFRHRCRCLYLAYVSVQFINRKTAIICSSSVYDMLSVDFPY